MNGEDPSSSWAECSETSQPGVSTTDDPTSETDQALLNNLFMSNPRPAVQSYSSVTASDTRTQSSQSPPRNSSFRPRKLNYLTRFEREHFHTNNVTPDRPCSAFFNIPTRQIFDALIREGIPASAVRCLQRYPRGSVDIAFYTEAVRDKLVGLSSFVIGQRPHVPHPSCRPVTFVTIYDAPNELPPSALQARLSKYGKVFSQRLGKLQEFPGVLNGLRHLRMDIHTPILSYLRFGNFLLCVYYDGQPKMCRKCNASDHLGKDCNNNVCFNCDTIGHTARECEESVRCCICKSEEHMAIDCPHSWSRRSASQRDAAREATESLATQEVVEPPESPEVPAPPMSSPGLDEQETANSDSSGSEDSQAADAEVPNFMEQDDQIHETEVANVDEAFSDDEGSSLMSPGLMPRALRKRGRTDDEDTSPELLSKSPRTPSLPSPTQDSGTSDSLEPNAPT